MSIYFKLTCTCKRVALGVIFGSILERLLNLPLDYTLHEEKSWLLILCAWLSYNNASYWYTVISQKKENFIKLISKTRKCIVTFSDVELALAFQSWLLNIQEFC